MAGQQPSHIPEWPATTWRAVMAEQDRLKEEVAILQSHLKEGEKENRLLEIALETEKQLHAQSVQGLANDLGQAIAALEGTVECLKELKARCEKA